MAKRETSVADFKVAPRKPRPDPQAYQNADSNIDLNTEQPSGEVEMTGSVGEEGAVQPALTPVAEQRGGKLISPDENIRRDRTTTRALRQEASRLRLQDLKQNKTRESKHFVNCPLDFDTKQRLARAATENEVKMTIIIKTAIDQYLRDNGY